MAKLTVSGGKLYLGSEELRGELGWNWFYGAQDALNATSLETYTYATEFALMASYGCRVVRMPLTPMWPSEWSALIGTTTPSSATFYTRLDAVMNAAAAAGISVVGTLFWRFATVPDLKAERISQLGVGTSASRAYMTAFVAEIVARYKDHAALGGWEISNESELYAEAGTFLSVNTGKGTPASYSAPLDTFTFEMYRDIAAKLTAQIRSIDNPKVLVLQGAGGAQPHVSRQAYWSKPQFADQRHADHVDTHLYSYVDFVGKDISQAGPYLARLAQEARGRPVIIGEFGAGAVGDGSDAIAEARIRAAYPLIRAHAALALQWQWSVYDTSYGVHPTTPRSAGHLVGRPSGMVASRGRGPVLAKNGPPFATCMRAVGGATTGINVPDAAILRPPVFTVMCWGKLMAATAATARKLLMKGNGTNDGWRLVLLPGAGMSPGSVYGEMKATDGTNKASTVADTGPRFGQWAHHAITFDGTYMTKWRDGLSVGNKLDFTGKSWAASANDLRIGSNVGSEPWDGFISDVRMYDRVLTADEISAAMQGANIPGLVGWWKLNGDARDSSGNGNHGTPEASVLFASSATAAARSARGG